MIGREIVRVRLGYLQGRTVYVDAPVTVLLELVVA